MAIYAYRISMHKLFGEQLQKERKKKGMTALQMSKAWGVSRSYVTLIENGMRLPGKKNIKKIAAALKIEAGVVLNWYLEDISQKIKKNL
jgi:transcriptional regulator with XRE-family HTH domain